MSDFKRVAYRNWAPLLLVTINYIMYGASHIFEKFVFDNFVFSLMSVKQVPHTVGTIFTSQFIHGSLLHFAGNTVVLLIVGLLLQARFSNTTIFTGYIISGAITTIAQSMTAPNTAYIIGGSGGLFFLVTLYIYQVSSNIEEKYFSYGILFFIPTILFEQTYKLMTTSNSIGYTSHIAGTILGIIFVGYLLYRTRKDTDD